MYVLVGCGPLPGCQDASWVRLAWDFFMIFWFETHTYSFWGNFTVTWGPRPMYWVQPSPHPRFQSPTRGLLGYPKLKKCHCYWVGLKSNMCKVCWSWDVSPENGLCLFLFGGLGRLLMLANESWVCAFHFWWMLRWICKGMKQCNASVSRKVAFRATSYCQSAEKRT